MWWYGSRLPAWSAKFNLIIVVLFGVWFVSTLCSVACLIISGATPALRWFAGYFHFLALLIFSMVLPIYMRPRDHHRHGNCLRNQQRIAEQMLIYAQDHQGRLPDTWDGIAVRSGMLRCPLDRQRHGGYGLNDAVRGTVLASFEYPETLLLTADTPHPNTYLQTPEDIDWQRHGENTTYASFLDGHVGALTREEARLR
jgi:prepilin-type processing-associated H-X9-DG protein